MLDGCVGTLNGALGGNVAARGMVWGVAAQNVVARTMSSKLMAAVPVGSADSPIYIEVAEVAHTAHIHNTKCDATRVYTGGSAVGSWFGAGLTVEAEICSSSCTRHINGHVV